ncbi:zinc-ribbon domain-containing protein [Rhodococcus erythropolis]|uniref:zinc-ribbon domain-containing protein n=1 Tax=Rhodococcus erythropolis TaxID=1833 RepID=UPI001BE5DEAB|nr:DUF559 domain-containing protein [Rhodococcus erythropolis]
MPVRVIPGVTDLATLRPDLASQWHPELNEKSPSGFAAKSHYKAWWLCKKNHAWQATIASRSGGTGCPFCAGKKVLAGFNDLASQRPDVAAQWHPTLNGDLAATEVTPMSNRSIWWRCSERHDWRAPVYSRASGTGCPVCTGRRIMQGYNDLCTTHPKLASEWHPTMNSIPPTAVYKGTVRKFWWSCSAYGHEWHMSPNDRIRQNQNCPFCAGKKVLVGFNDLASRRPDIATQWHPRNNITAHQVTTGSNKSVWWVCTAHGHEWKTAIHNRTRHGCPTCTGRRVLAGFNDLTTSRPQLTTEWHPTKNTHQVSNVTAGSRYTAWWRCNAYGHEWQAEVVSRANGYGCPVCSGHQVRVGFNDLTTTHPQLSAEWHPTKNECLPTEVSAGSDIRAWWRCVEGHEWDVPISSRSARGGTSCPHCCTAGTSTRERDICGLIAVAFDAADYDGPTSIEGWRWGVDLALHDLKLVVEYDGWYWHQNKADHDLRKTRALENAGWTVVRIRETSANRSLPSIPVTAIECTDSEPAAEVAQRVIRRINFIRLTLP